MSKKYYTVLESIDNGPWAIAFGDYDRETADDEKQNIIDQGDQSKVICTSDEQADIDAKVDEMNAAIGPLDLLADLRAIKEIATRGVALALANGQVDLSHEYLTRILTATHQAFCKLDLQGLLTATDGNFSHDIFGIVRHYSETGLTEFFTPRFAVNQ